MVSPYSNHPGDAECRMYPGVLPGSPDSLKKIVGESLKVSYSRVFSSDRIIIQFDPGEIGAVKEE